MEKALLRSRGDREGIRLCGLYIKKIRNSVAPLSEDFLQRWEGSDFKAYLPSVRFLVERGFQVLLTGDTDIPEDVAEEFGGMFVNGDAIGIDSDLFKIYAALHTDIFIGDCGGGWSLAGLSAERPMLGLNVFSFFCSDGKFWLYYKHAFDGRGNHVPFRDMARKYAFNKNFPETYTAVKNSADEILEAVRCYVDEMEHPGSSKVDSSLEDLWPVYSEFKISGSHISPAFVENYNKKRALADVA